MFTPTSPATRTSMHVKSATSAAVNIFLAVAAWKGTFAATHRGVTHVRYVGKSGFQRRIVDARMF
jgi:hypothetical protein